jgi:capsular exopolysaccharide synthesis family protein
MSKFYQALERAERERTSRSQERLQEEVRLDPPSALPSASHPPRRPTRSENGIASLQRESEKSSPRTIEDHLVSLIAPETFEAERYRMLSYIVEQLHADAGLSVIAVSSPAVGDGKTLTAINLASALTQLPGARVLLIDLDVRRPSIAANLGMEQRNNPGLIDFIQNQTLSLEDVLYSYPSSKLTVLFTGQMPVTPPYDTLKSSRLENLIEDARQNYDYVVVDTPPLVPFPDCRLIERFVDGVLVVVSAHRTPRKLATEAISTIDPEKIVGIVFNNDDQSTFGDYSYYSYETPASAGENVGMFNWFKKSFSNYSRNGRNE